MYGGSLLGDYVGLGFGGLLRPIGWCGLIMISMRYLI